MSEFYFMGSKLESVRIYTIENIILQLVFIFCPKILIPEKIHQAHGAAQKAKKSLQKPKAQKSVCT